MVIRVNGGQRTYTGPHCVLTTSSGQPECSQCARPNERSVASPRTISAVVNTSASPIRWPPLPNFSENVALKKSYQCNYRQHPRATCEDVRHGAILYPLKAVVSCHAHKLISARTERDDFKMLLEELGDVVLRLGGMCHAQVHLSDRTNASDHICGRNLVFLAVILKSRLDFHPYAPLDQYQANLSAS